MPAQTVNYQCPACTGPLHFVGASGKLECDYCGSQYDVAEIENYMASKNSRQQLLLRLSLTKLRKKSRQVRQPLKLLQPVGISLMQALNGLHKRHLNYVHTPALHVVPRLSAMKPRQPLPVCTAETPQWYRDSFKAC